MSAPAEEPLKLHPTPIGYDVRRGDVKVGAVHRSPSHQAWVLRDIQNMLVDKDEVLERLVERNGIRMGS